MTTIQNLITKINNHDNNTNYSIKINTHLHTVSITQLMDISRNNVFSIYDYGGVMNNKDLLAKLRNILTILEE